MVPFSCPGHKRGQGAAGEVRALLGDGVFDCDVWLNTGDHDRLRRVAESLAARVWGADRSFFLVNGSSSGNHAYLLAAAGPGDEVIVARDLHKSLLVGLILTGARPVYVAPRVHPSSTSASGWPPATSPPPSPAGGPVYVDEAWAPPRLPSRAPAGAMAAGADGAVTAPTSTVEPQPVPRSSTSAPAGRPGPGRHHRADDPDHQPALALLASLDACRQQLSTDGERLWAGHRAGRDARRRLRLLPGLDVLGPDRLGLRRAASTRSSWSSTCPGSGSAGRRPNGCYGTASPSPRTPATGAASSAW